MANTDKATSHRQLRLTVLLITPSLVPGPDEMRICALTVRRSTTRPSHPAPLHAPQARNLRHTRSRRLGYDFPSQLDRRHHISILAPRCRAGQGKALPYRNRADLARRETILRKKFDLPGSSRQTCAVISLRRSTQRSRFGRNGMVSTKPTMPRRVPADLAGRRS
jgi:hypothetical protein